MVSLVHVVARNPRAASRAWPAETVVYLPDDNTIHSLNETASAVWEFLVHKPTVAQIVRHVAHEFEVDEEQVTQDVKTLLETLAARNLIVLSGGLNDDDARGVSATAQESSEAGRQMPLLSQIRVRAQEQNIPMHALLELTNNCNWWCRHCYITHRPAKGELTLDEIRPILDQLAELGVLFLTFTGGEPLTRKDFFDIAEYARQRDFSFSLFTNGTLITPTVADRLKELALERAEISILGAKAATHDAITQVEGSFDRTIEHHCPAQDHLDEVEYRRVGGNLRPGGPHRSFVQGGKPDHPSPRWQRGEHRPGSGREPDVGDAAAAPRPVP
jgi:hypothetical protein